MYAWHTYFNLHSGQLLSSFKCYFKRKYLNPIDSNCDVDEPCPWFFIGTILVRSARESRSVALVWRLGILVTGAWFCAHAGGNNNSVKRIAAVLGGVCFFGVFVCILSNVITIQYNLIL